jgi:FKBP-type peptidyl-prolyl cis-trans isomerase FklB
MNLKTLAIIATTGLVGFTANAQNKKPSARPASPTTKTARPATKPTVVSSGSGQGSVMKNGIDSLSYAIGVNIGQSFKAQGLDILNTPLMFKALNEQLKGLPSSMKQEDVMMVINSQMQQMQAKKAAQDAIKYEPLKKEGADYMAENGKKDGVITLPSGLQYKVLTAGTGTKPTADQSVTVHYTGKLINGKVFDSSVERGQPATFGVTQVIQGWVEALQLMPQGSKWELTIPYNLAYGERGAGENIPPFSTLIFDVELISISGGAANEVPVESVMPADTEKPATPKQ